VRAWVEVQKIRARRWLALIPYRRALSVCLGIFAGFGCVCAGLIVVDHPLRSFPFLLVGVLVMGFAFMLWEME